MGKYIYLFSIQTSWEIEADDEEEAYELLDGKESESSKIVDQDVMLVETLPNPEDTNDG